MRPSTLRSSWMAKSSRIVNCNPVYPHNRLISTPLSQFSPTNSFFKLLDSSKIFSTPPQQTRSITKITTETDYKGVSLYHVKYYLKNKSIPFTETHPCLKISLPSYVFGEKLSTEWSKVKESITQVFINKVTGNFVCPDHGFYGSWIQLETLLNTWIQSKKSHKTLSAGQIPKVSRIRTGLPEDVQIIWDSGRDIGSLTTPEFKQVLGTFKLIQKCFKKEDFEKFGVKCSKDLKELLFPVKYVTGDVIGLKHLKVVDKCLVETNLPEVVSNGNNVLPFFHNLEVPWVDLKNTECILVGSVLDSVVISTRTEHHVICLPDWTRLSPDLLPFLDQFRTITIWLGGGVQGVETARNFAKKIGDKHCRVVSNEYPSAMEAVMKKMDVNEILESAARQHHQYITSFDTLRHDVFLEFLQADQMEGVKWTRFDKLNETLKGFRRGEMTVITGRTGSGKTTFMSEYSIDLCQQGVSTLWGSFEVQNVRLVRTMMKQFSLVDLDNNLREFDKVAERFSQLPMYFTTFHGTNEVEKVLDAMAHAVYVHDIAHVIIDNIQFMVGSGSGNIDRFTKQDQCVEMYRKFATLHNVHVTLVIHPRKDQEERLTIHSIFGGGKATQEADNVMLLQTEETELPEVKRKHLEIVKNRYSGDLGIVPLYFTKSVLSLSKKVANQMKNVQKASRNISKSGEEKIHS